MEKIRKCKICAQQFIGKTNAKYCSGNCHHKATLAEYYTRLREKQCKYCGQQFSGRLHERICGQCKGTRHVATTKEKPLLCPRCKTNQIDVITVITLHKRPRYGCRLCNECKEQSRKNIQERMKSNQNPAIQIHGRKKIIHRDKVKTAIQRSLRMTINNPMYKPEVKAKVALTRALHPSAYPKGQKHKLWKGLRDKAQTIRSRLYLIWTKPILIRDNFTCCKCGKTKCRLEVHHIKPTFREILNMYLAEKDINNLSYEEFEILSTKIEKFHQDGMVLGITYCVNCHKEVDSRRR